MQPKRLIVLSSLLLLMAGPAQAQNEAALSILKGLKQNLVSNDPSLTANLSAAQWKAHAQGALRSACATLLMSGVSGIIFYSQAGHLTAIHKAAIVTATALAAAAIFRGRSLENFQEILQVEGNEALLEFNDSLAEFRLVIRAAEEKPMALSGLANWVRWKDRTLAQVDDLSWFESKFEEWLAAISSAPISPLVQTKPASAFLQWLSKQAKLDPV